MTKPSQGGNIKEKMQKLIFKDTGQEYQINHDNTRKITFKDKGQDLLWILIDGNDYIIDCNAEKSIWLGYRVDKRHLNSTFAV